MSIKKTILGALLSCLVLVQGAAQPAHSVPSRKCVNIAAAATGGANSGNYTNGRDELIGSTQSLSCNTLFGTCPEYAYDFSLIFTNGVAKYATGVNLPSANSINCSNYLYVPQFTCYSMSYLPQSQVNEDAYINVYLLGCPPGGSSTVYTAQNQTPSARTNRNGQVYFNWTAPLCAWTDGNGNAMPCGTTVKAISVQLSGTSSLQTTWVGNFAVNSACSYYSLCPTDFNFVPPSCELDNHFDVNPPLTNLL